MADCSFCHQNIHSGQPSCISLVNDMVAAYHSDCWETVTRNWQRGIATAPQYRLLDRCEAGVDVDLELFLANQRILGDEYGIRQEEEQALLNFILERTGGRQSVNNENGMARHIRDIERLIEANRVSRQWAGHHVLSMVNDGNINAVSRFINAAAAPTDTIERGGDFMHTRNDGVDLSLWGPETNKVIEKNSELLAAIVVAMAEDSRYSESFQPVLEKARELDELMGNYKELFSEGFFRNDTDPS